jgi:hypothetical protein
MEWLGVSSLVLTACVVALGFILLSLAQQIGVLHERTQPMASGLKTKTVQEGDAVVDIAPPISPSQGAVVTLLFVATTCPVCRLLHGAFIEWVTGHPSEHGYWVFPMDKQQAIDEYTGSLLATQCGVTRTPTLVRLQYSDKNWRLLLRQPIDRVQELSGRLTASEPEFDDRSVMIRGAQA